MKISFLSALALLLIGLRLGHVIAWSWWLVLLPIWGGLAIFLVVTGLTTIVALLLLGIVTVIESCEKASRRRVAAAVRRP